MSDRDLDIEKASATASKDGPTVRVSDSRSDSTDGNSWLDALNRKSLMLEAKIGMETRGIERVPDDPEIRTDKPYSNTFVWLAANCTLPTLGIGALGPELFYLGLGDSMLIIFFTNVFVAMLPAYMATFGPKLGLRQMTAARFAWGWYGAKFVALLNCIACVGWSTINSIAGAQTLRVVADEEISHAAGVVIIAAITLVVGLLGYKQIHRYEKYAWIPTAITFVVLLGCGASGMVNVPMGSGRLEASNALSFIGVVSGFAMGWVSLASDYNVYQPSSTPSWQTFLFTYLGLIFPLVLVQWLGAALYLGTTANTAWADAFEANGLGGLVDAAMRPKLGHGGSGFFEVLLVLSVCTNNIPNVYSMGLSVSVIATWIARIPRLVWPFVITAIYIPIAIAGANSLSSSLENFMNVLAYWLAIFVAVFLSEHFFFRNGDFASYDVERWNDPAAFPVGIAALCALGAGAIGTAMGMAQVWYIGPIGKLVGGSVNPFGGDIGYELSGAFAAVVYIPVRYFEKRHFGK